MVNKYKLVQKINDVETTKEYKTLKEISEALNIELHLVRKNNKITEGRFENKRAHFANRDFFDNYKIYNIKKVCKNI
jgi:hypothetical protein